MESEGSPRKSDLRAAIRAGRAERVAAVDEGGAAGAGAGASAGGDVAAAAESLCAHIRILLARRRPAAVVAYAALPGEPDLDPVLDALIALGTPVLLPATRRGEPLQLGRVTGPMSALPRGIWDIREPHTMHPAPEALAAVLGESPARGAGVEAEAGFAAEATAGAAAEPGYATQAAEESGHAPGPTTASGGISGGGSGEAFGGVSGGGSDRVLVLTPGLAFDTQGARLGNGAGFYDKTFGPQGQLAHESLSSLRRRLDFVGVCWDAEVQESLPVQPWDLVVDAIVTERGIRPAAARR